MGTSKKTDEEKEKNKQVGAIKARITREETRLTAVFKNLPPNEKAVAVGLIQRAAYMRVTLEDYEKDINAGGSVEPFQQKAGAPSFDRVRPVAQLYTTLAKNYQTIIKQLTDLLPKGDEVSDPKKGDDGFDDFVNKKN
ncbi:hypothetical protein [Paenibacillus sp. sgz302251]|uniref:hypothetical protein n=1 Tax=Paenibacillus sp. sgz302251 TaxID=3414493 RepID=UPI003C799240